MSWLQLTLDIPAQDAETISNLLTELGAVAVALRDGSDQPIYEPPPGETPLWSTVTVTGLFDAATDLETVRTRLLEVLGSDTACRIEALEERDWERAWIDEFRPMQFSQRLWVCPSWCEPPDPNGVIIRLDPGLAFGIGSHPTTALCLEWLDAATLGGCDVLDYGCGSGVLAVAASLLGARSVTAVDIDPRALEATRDNARRNRVADRISTSLAPDAPLCPVDLLLANILSRPLTELAPGFADRLRPGGDLVLSGILEDQADAVLETYRPWFRMSAPVRRDGWVRLHGIRARTT